MGHELPLGHGQTPVAYRPDDPESAHHVLDGRDGEGGVPVTTGDEGIEVLLKGGDVEGERLDRGPDRILGYRGRYECIVGLDVPALSATSEYVSWRIPPQRHHVSMRSEARGPRRRQRIPIAAPRQYRRVHLEVADCGGDTPRRRTSIGGHLYAVAHTVVQDCGRLKALGFAYQESAVSAETGE